MRILKTEVQGLHQDDPADDAPDATVQAPQPQIEAPTAGVGAQAQIDALSKQLADLQQSVKTTDGAQAK
jgi:hypothetical protein